MSSSGLLRDLSSLCADLRSEKLTIRNKASEKLDNILTNTKTDLFVLFRKRETTNEVSWTDIFDSAIHATLKHAAKLEESQDSKSVQTMRNKNHIFTAIVTKLIDYSLEDHNNFLSKSTLLSAFFDGFSIRSAVKSFGILFLYVLETGIYKSKDNLDELKVNEYSRILSYLFEINTANDENLRYAILRATNKTIELAEQNVQLSADLIDYLPEVKIYAASADDERRKAEVIKLFHLFISQLSLDYHIAVCTNVQDVLPIICGFYNFRMKNEAKETLFSSIVISLTAIYPHLKSTYCNITPIESNLNQHWNKTLKKIETIMEIEIKERRTQLYRSGDVVSKRCYEVFIEMSELIVFLTYWNKETSTEDLNDAVESRKKKQKITDSLEIVLVFVQPHVPTFNETWLAILAKLLNTHHNIINSNNFQQVLEATFQIMSVFANADNLKNVRLCILSLLRYEKNVRDTNMNYNSCDNIWNKMVEFVINDTSVNKDVISEKQLIIQSLIRHKKISLQGIHTLLQSFLVQKNMRRTECIATVREILKNADCLGLDKTADIIVSVLKWIYAVNGKIDTKTMLLDIEPIDCDVIADTAAIAIINFLSKSEETKRSKFADLIPQSLLLLLYKYNRKYVCIEEHGAEIRLLSELNKENSDDQLKNCLFQSNYELVMCQVNFETTKETSPSDILIDLTHLETLVCLMDKLFKYNVFSHDNYSQCPLIKRIGFFLSHLEFQLKNNDPKCIDRSDLVDVLHRIKVCIQKFTSNNILLSYVEAQPLEELINFVGYTLLSVSRKMRGELDSFDNITCTCLQILAMLCASNTHFKDAFGQIFKHKFGIKADFTTLIALIKIFCTQKERHPEVATWFVDKLKTICQLYHNNKDISTSILEQLPAIFKYVQGQEEQLQNMLIILSSLLKKTYKKSYSSQFGAKLIESVRLISQNSAQDKIQNDFKNICMSVTKFISSSSLEVQFAAINTITALMDFKWFCTAREPSDSHFKFCEELMAQIDYKSLVTTTSDNRLNSISVTTQLLVAVFVFGSYHQETALQELSYFCALRKLNESNFFQFDQIATYFNCSLSELTNPYVPNLIHTWAEKKYPISKLPYYLCSNKRETFILENLYIITTCVLLHYNVDEFKKLEKYKSQIDLIELAMPSILALTMSYKAGCWATDKNSSNFIEHLLTNLNLLSIDLRHKNGESTTIWKTVFKIIDIFGDGGHFQEMFGFSLFLVRKEWYNISYDSLSNSLHCYLRNCGMILDESSCAMFSLVIIKQSSILVRVFTALKKKICNAVFLMDKLKSLHLYCTFGKLVVDAIEMNKTNIVGQNNKKFFIRDIIFHLLHMLQDAIGEQKLQCAVLNFLQYILGLTVVTDGFCCEILRTNYNFIIKALISSVKNCSHEVVCESSINVINLVINSCKELQNEFTTLFDDLPKNEKFDKLRDTHNPTLSEEAEDLETFLKDFLAKQNHGPELLLATRKCIANHKEQLPFGNSSLVHDVMKKLLEITCNSSNDTCSIDATKCLGEIGPLKLNGFSYYFETDISFYRSEAVLKDPLEYFTESLLNIIEKIILRYNKKTFATVCLVCEQLINSKNGLKFLGSSSYLEVFRSKLHEQNYLNSYDKVENIDLLMVLKNTILLSYEEWICNFVSKLYAFFGWRDFEDLCCSDITFAESSFVPLFKILISNQFEYLDDILAMLDYFFNEVFDAINGNSQKICTIYRDKRIIKHFLNVCECIRISNKWNLPKVNLLYVANACNFCQAFFLAILYFELWCAQKKSTESESEASNYEIMTNKLFQDVAVKAYDSIGCSDAISGFLNPMNSRLDFLNIEGTWSDVLLHADATEFISSSVLTNNLKRNGLLSLANLNQNVKSTDYEMCWRLCQWDTTVEGHSKINTLNDMEQEFKKHHFNSLKCIHKREEMNSLAAISNARNCLVLILKEISFECLHSIYKYLTWLQLLQEAEDFCQIQFTSTKDVLSIFSKWKVDTILDYGNFSCKDQILSHQATLFKIAGIRANRKFKDYFQDTNPLELCHLKSIQNCIYAGEINLAIRNIAVMKNMKLSNENIQVSVLLKDAEVCSKTGKSVITKAILEHLIKNKDFAFCLQRVKAYRMYGEFLMESNTESFETVLSKFFRGSIDLINQFDKNKEKIILKNPSLLTHESFIQFDHKNRKRAYQSIAKYADREYTQLNMYSNSEEFQTKCKIIQENRQAADLVGKQNKDRDKNIGAIFMKKFANLDEKEILSVKQKRTDNLCIAIENYIKFCIIDQAITSPAIYRIIALWFANKNNETLHANITKDIDSIPSYKFLCALNQMTARLNSKNQEFLKILRDILVRCAQDHPHHTLYQLFPLVNAFTDSENNTSNDRVSIAKDIINKSKTKSNSSCIKQLEILFPALIDFANEKATENKAAISEKLKRMKNLDAIQCPTMELAVATNKLYKITSIVKWEDKVALVGGINAPKKVTCLCSDGVKRSQLLKARDDLRQDAVMQQVFSMLNDLLNSEMETNKRKLKLRTYKVVPLSMRSGILEWCQNTIPLGVYLSGDGKNGAHKKYRPKDYTIQKCRSLSMQHLKSDADKRLEIYLHICTNLQPVLHFFFFEKFLVPGEWFERRLAYINSVAANSIIGFILGLGDRHTQNILIDEKTAEVIHIDFGIAFEQGKIMPTPETVPFRLTRDIVAPMGVCETNGLFKKSCEVMMATLRRNQAVIITILEVLLHDPLYIWKVVPSALDNSTSEQTNSTAQRALLCVQNKLEGKQAGIFGISEVDVQVQRLINDAISSKNLCMLYPGWDPYL